MEITVKDLSTGERVVFPMLPDRITTTAAQSFISFRIMQLGEVKIPNGEELMKFSWNGILPGNSRRNVPYVGSWTTPERIQESFNVWRNKHHKLRLTITDTPINHSVYLEDYTCEEAGGCGDVFYSVSFVLSKVISISATKAPVKKAASKTATAKASTTSGKKSHTVVAGDTLWMIAQKYMGDGSKYAKLYSANKGVIDPRNKQYAMPAYTIYPGQVLQIP